MATVTREKAGVRLQSDLAGLGGAVDEQACDGALLARVWNYIDRNQLEPEILRIVGEESRRNGTDRLTLDEINEVIRAARADRKR